MALNRLINDNKKNHYYDIHYVKYFILSELIVCNLQTLENSAF